MSSWALVNLRTGDATMERRQMDVSFDNGSVIELPGPESIPAQRVEKSSVERQGSNRFSSGWGSTFAALIGAKLVAAEIAREIGTGLRLMIGALITEQSRVSRRTPLVPSETIVRLAGAQVASSIDRIEVSASIVVGNGNTLAATAGVTR